MWFDSFKTPIGRLVVAADENGLRHVLFENNRYDARDRDTWTRDAGALRDAREQLLAYFAGERRVFDLRLHPVGTPFQRKVWDALTEIPFGATRSYGDLARRIGDPKAVRAVGAANGRNPLPILVPCHRVIGSDGKMVGFGGGLPTKQFLLVHEGIGSAATVGTRRSLRAERAG
jgi:methylated-DNA-[protein]-cysteine S-methyltransferase